MSSSISLTDLITLGRNRWTVPLLADLAGHGGGRFVELVHRLSISRDSLVRTLDAARDQGWIILNPGHGHPLRPEYVLTKQGERLAGCAESIRIAQIGHGIAPGTLTCWGLPLVHAIGHGHQRFNALARTLSPASPRALSQGLQRLAGHELVNRELLEGYPPTSRYWLTNKGEHLASGL